MSTVEVSISLPFLLRMESSVRVPYEIVCQESRVRDLIGKQVQISFSRIPAGSIDKSDWPPKERSTVAIKVECGSDLSSESVNRFALRNCAEILNRLIICYQATTGEVSNAGFIVPMGTADMQLFAEIRLNGQDIRDRWPSHGINTLSLPPSAVQVFAAYLSGHESLPLPKVLLVNATLSLESGQYSLAVLQGAAAVELRLAQVVRGKLEAAGWSDAAIRPCEQMTLGGKLGISATDPRSVETYFPGASNEVASELVALRNRVAHRGHLATHEEGIRAMTIARRFLDVVK